MNHVRAAIWWRRVRRLFGGLPCRLQVAALPWRKTKRGVEVMLVTSRDTGRWVLPKGWPEFGEQFCEAAAREAGEEAGLKGAISTHEAGRYYYSKGLAGGDSVRCEVLVYPLEVDGVAGKWKEKGQRKRKWLTPAKAAEMVAERDLGEVILAFAGKPNGAAVLNLHDLAGPHFDSLGGGSAYHFIGSTGLGFGVEETPMEPADFAASTDAEAYDAVFTTLLEYHPGDIVSTHDALAQVRRLAPDCALGDEELIGLIVRMATGTTMIISFDHREAA